MEAVLVQAPCWAVNTPPYNLALLKAACEQAGHRVHCLDLNIRFYHYCIHNKNETLYANTTDWYLDTFTSSVVDAHAAFMDESVRRILQYPAKVIGFTVTGLNKYVALYLAKKIKETERDRVIIFGGPHCFKNEFGTTILENNPSLDIVCYQEGEEALPRILSRLERSLSLENIRGISFRDSRGMRRHGPQEALLDSLDTAPFADYSDFDLLEYYDRELPISTSRGCINRCVFCGESRIWKRYRSRSAENIYEEIVYQRKRYPFIKSFTLNDSLINGDLRMLDALCNLLIRNKIHIGWGGQASIRKGMTREFLLKMRRAGLCHVSYGLESASPRILQFIGKQFTPRIAEEVIRNTKRAGIRTDVNIVIGFPIESEEDFMLTADFLKRNREFIDEIFYHPLVITNGTPLYERRSEYGIEFDQEHNPNSWYCAYNNNTLARRLEVLEFYKTYVEGKGESFFSLSDYWIFAADACAARGEYQKAYDYYQRARSVNTSSLKSKTIQGKIESVRKKVNS